MTDFSRRVSPLSRRASLAIHHAFAALGGESAGFLDLDDRSVRELGYAAGLAWRLNADGAPGAVAKLREKLPRRVMLHDFTDWYVARGLADPDLEAALRHDWGLSATKPDHCAARFDPNDPERGYLVVNIAVCFKYATISGRTSSEHRRAEETRKGGY